MRFSKGLTHRILCLGALCFEPASAIAQQAPAAKPEWVLDFSGEARGRFESARNPVFGLFSPGRNDYLLHRVVLSSELHRAGDFRMVADVASGFTSGWTGSPPSTQENRLDLLQIYIEPSFRLGREPLKLRVGRQEMSFGAARLVSVRESPNIRRAFDGLRAIWTRGNLSVNTFFLRPVIPEGGVLDDRSSPDQQFWGLYATGNANLFTELGFDVYYLGIKRVDAEFSVGTAQELRHTVGVRLFGAREGWDWNVESALQGGSFGGSTIRAWTVSVDMGYEFAGHPLPIRIGLKADAASGDRDPHDHQLGTFNPLFPKLPYFSEANLVAPANLLDLQPNLRLSLSDSWSLYAAWNGLWKHEPADAMYAPPLVPVQRTSQSNSREIGWQASLLIEWQVKEYLEFATTFVRFEPHKLARQWQGSGGEFFGAWLRFTF